MIIYYVSILTQKLTNEQKNVYYYIKEVNYKYITLNNYETNTRTNTR